jgi:hypothetical protein
MEMENRKKKRRLPASVNPQPFQQHDICRGAKAIGEVLGLTERQAFWALESGQVPATKLGRIWTASRARLLARVTRDDTDQRRAS